MKYDLAFLRICRPLGRSHGIVKNVYAISARRPRSHVAVLSEFVPNEDILNALLLRAGLPTHPSTELFFSVTDEQLSILGIDAKSLD